MWIAKPNLNNSIGLEVFTTAKEGAEYLEKYTGIEMAYDRNRKTKEITYDWEIIEKLWQVKEETCTI
tara:strand:- start:3873 stop:4073 length:201 start_codon:yes stop_codon:yes gene_type:complete